MNRQIEPVSSAALPANAVHHAIMSHPTPMRALANNSLLLILIPCAILLAGVLASYAVHGELVRRADDSWRDGAQKQTQRLDVALADALRATQVPVRAITGLFLGSEASPNPNSTGPSRRWRPTIWHPAISR